MQVKRDDNGDIFYNAKGDGFGVMPEESALPLIAMNYKKKSI